MGNFEQKAKVVANLLGIATGVAAVLQYLLLVEHPSSRRLRYGD